MPVYEYECQECHERVEDTAKFSDPPLSVCPLCGGKLKRVFSGVAISFKGKGFYRNDSRSSGGSKPAKGAAKESFTKGSSDAATGSTSTAS